MLNSYILSRFVRFDCITAKKEKNMDLKIPRMTLSQRNRNPATLAGWMSTHQHFSSMMKNGLHLRDMAYPSRPGLIAMFDMNGIATRFGSPWLWCWKRRWWCPWSSPTGKCLQISIYSYILSQFVRFDCNKRKQKHGFKNSNSIRGANDIENSRTFRSMDETAWIIKRIAAGPDG